MPPFAHKCIAVSGTDIMHERMCSAFHPAPIWISPLVHLQRLNSPRVLPDSSFPYVCAGHRITATRPNSFMRDSHTLSMLKRLRVDEVRSDRSGAIDPQALEQAREIMESINAGPWSRVSFRACLTMSSTNADSGGARRGGGAHGVGSASWRSFSRRTGIYLHACCAPSGPDPACGAAVLDSQRGSPRPPPSLLTTVPATAAMLTLLVRLSGRIRDAASRPASTPGARGA